MDASLINLGEAQKHLNSLSQNNRTLFTFQTFPDSGSVKMNIGLTKVLHGSLQEHAKALKRLNALGAGIFISVNETDGLGRKVENIIRIRALFADKDDGPFSDFDLPPSLVIQSKNGEHAYWMLKKSVSKEKFTEAQKRIAAKLGSDRSVSDPPRVMRLAGFFHLKDPRNPFLVTVKSKSHHTYGIEEITAAFPPETSKAADSLFYPTPENSAFSNWVNGLSIEEGNNNPFGGRNNTLLRIVREGLACNVSVNELTEIASGYCARSGEPRSAAIEMLRRQTVQHQETPFSSFFVNPNPKYSETELADLFLASRETSEDGVWKLRFFEGDYFRYNGTRYVRLPELDLKSEVTAFLQNSKLKARVTANLLNNVLVNIKGRVHVSGLRRPPLFFDREENKSAHLVPVKNGILVIDQKLKKARLLQHTPNFFSQSCLPYNFDFYAKCPNWIKFLNEILPDKEIHNFLQEWFGYNLIFDNTRQKFVLLVGEGANGKSVVCTVLKCLLGRENISAVCLEQFDPTRTFPMSAMVGKLANIVEEVGDLDKVAEGKLKEHVSGSTMTLERKHRDPFEVVPTARLTFAANSIPRFRDRSDGLWRRMIAIPFKHQILDPKMQNKNLVSDMWWEKSGELPGIFNWALRGLSRLVKQDHFTIPRVSAELGKTLKDESNPAITFLKENYHFWPESVLPSDWLYRRYSSWITEAGGTPLGKPQFTREVSRAFPKAELSEHARRQKNGERCREWIGLREIR